MRFDNTVMRFCVISTHEALSVKNGSTVGSSDCLDKCLPNISLTKHFNFDFKKK